MKNSNQMAQNSVSNFENINTVLTHIFGDKYETGLDYLKLLITKPNQKLPILILDSEENQNGKSTFIHLLKLLMNEKMEIVSMDQLLSAWNYSYATKSLVACEEGYFFDDIATNGFYKYIRLLSIAPEVVVQEPGVYPMTIPSQLRLVFTGHIIKSEILDQVPNSFWVRKIPTITNPYQIEKFFKEEMPFFIDFLSKREMETYQKTPYWFNISDLYGDPVAN